MPSRSGTKRVALAWALTSGFVAGAAAAEESSQQVRLAWVRGEGAESCPDEDALMDQVRARIGRDPFEKGAKLRIEGAIDHHGGEWHAELQIRSDTSTPLGTRRLATTAEDCGAITEAVVLAIALTIDPSRSAGAAAAFPLEPPPSAPGPLLTSSSPLPPPPPPRVVAPTKQHRAPAPSEPGSQTMAVLASGGLAVGILPRPSPLASLTGLYGSEHLRLTAGIFVIPEQETRDGRFAFGLTSGSAGACYGANLRPGITASLCAGLQLGALHASVIDTQRLVPLSPGDHLWLAGAAGPALSWTPAAPLRLEAGARGVVPIILESFMIRNSSEVVFQSAPVAVMAYMGVGVGLP